MTFEHILEGSMDRNCFPTDLPQLGAVATRLLGPLPQTGPGRNCTVGENDQASPGRRDLKFLSYIFYPFRGENSHFLSQVVRIWSLPSPSQSKALWFLLHFGLQQLPQIAGLQLLGRKFRHLRRLRGGFSDGVGTCFRRKPGVGTAQWYIQLEADWGQGPVRGGTELEVK